tara:strand:+ start:131656 stop:131826 length:171 start_codon:yes stop_codon:yes gene_type:complete
MTALICNERIPSDFFQWRIASGTTKHLVSAKRPHNFDHHRILSNVIPNGGIHDSID